MSAWQRDYVIWQAEQLTPSRRFFILLWESGPQMVQLALALNAFWLAMILIDPEPTFPTALGYRWMAARATETHWAAICLSFAIIGGYGCVSRNLHARAAAAFASSILTGVLGYGFWISNPAGTGSGTYLILTMLSYWLLWQRVFRHGT